MQTELKTAPTNLFTYLAFKGLHINRTKCHFMLLGKQYLDISKPNLSFELFDDVLVGDQELVRKNIFVLQFLGISSQEFVYVFNVFIRNFLRYITTICTTRENLNPLPLRVPEKMTYQFFLLFTPKK